MADQRDTSRVLHQNPCKSSGKSFLRACSRSSLTLQPLVNNCRARQPPTAGERAGNFLLISPGLLRRGSAFVNARSSPNTHARDVYFRAGNAVRRKRLLTSSVCRLVHLFFWNIHSSGRVRPLSEDRGNRETSDVPAVGRNWLARDNFQKIPSRTFAREREFLEFLKVWSVLKLEILKDFELIQRFPRAIVHLKFVSKRFN